MISDRALRSLLRSDRYVVLVRDLVRVGALLVALSATVLGVGFWIVVCWPVLKYLHFNDFGKFYYSARMFLQGNDMYAPSLATSIPVAPGEWRQFLNMNPPHLHVIMLPLAVLDPGVAFAVWAAGSVVALVATLLLIARELRLDWTPAGIVWTVAAIATLSPVSTTVVTGQLTFLVMLPVTVAWALARQGRWNKAGVYLGVLISVKPFLGVFALYLALTRRWNALWCAAISAALVVGAGLLIFGPHAYLSWIRALSSVSWEWAPMNASLAGLVSRSFVGGPLVTPLARIPAVVPLVTLLTSSLVAVASLWNVTRGSLSHSTESVDRAWLLLMLAAELASPLGWIYYLPWCTGPAIGVWKSRRARKSPVILALVVLAIPGLLLPPFALGGGAPGRPIGGATAGSLYTWTVVFLWLATFIDSEARSRPADLDVAGTDAVAAPQ